LLNGKNAFAIQMSLSANPYRKLAKIMFYREVNMTEFTGCTPTREVLIDALEDAEWVLREFASRLDLPGRIRLQLLNAAERARPLIEAARSNGKLPPA
jgi:hypothetical protein